MLYTFDALCSIFLSYSHFLSRMIFKARLREMVTYEDLEEETRMESTALKIKDKNQFCQGIAAAETNQVILD